MRVSPIQQNSQSFGVYKKSHSRSLGNERIDSIIGETSDRHFTIYSQYTDNVLISKLHYVADKFDNFIKLKITQFQDGKILKTFIKAKKSPKAFEKLIEE